MVNSIPNEYIIFDNRSTKEFSKVSFSKYMTKDVLQAFNKSLLECKIEASIHWAVELVVSGDPGGDTVIVLKFIGIASSSDAS